MRLSLAIARWLPRWLGYAIAERGGRMYGRLAPQRRAILESNLAPVLGTDDPRELRRVAVQIFGHALRSYYELFYLPFVPTEQVADMVVVEGPGWELFQQAHRQGRGVVLISTHQSSFDLGGQSLAARGYVIHLLVLPDQAASMATIHKLRLERGLRAMPVGSRAVRESLRALRNGGILVVAADRTVKGQGTEVEFFGRPTLLPDGHVRLALRTDALVFGVFFYREDETYYMRFVPIELVRTGNKSDVRENVQRIARIIEEPIRAHPEQWHLFLQLWE